MIVYIGADHRGVKLKQTLLKRIAASGYRIRDIGAFVYDPGDDYPLVSESLGRAVSQSTEHRGILLCGSGVGASAAVNKIPGIRAAVGINAQQVQAGRHDDDMNVLVIAADVTDDQLSYRLATVFLTTPYHKTPRYQRRINQIKKLEEG